MASLIQKLRDRRSTTQLFKSGLIQTVFWTGISLLVFIQDYLDSSINDLGYFLSDSLLFKVFWLLFIPLSLSWFWVLEIFHLKFKEKHFFYAILILILGFGMCLLHLIAFAGLLAILSPIFASGWPFSWLFLDVISERSYITLAVYMGYALIYPWSGYSPETAPSGLIQFKSGAKSFILNMDEIMWVNVEHGMTKIKTATRQHIYGGSLKKIKSKLDPNLFKQIHRSTIVNIRAVDQLKSRLNGDYDVTIKDGSQLRLSRNYVNEVKGELL